MGDSRDQSFDSRFWGAVPLADVRGQARMIYWSFGNGRVRWNRIGRAIE